MTWNITAQQKTENQGQNGKPGAKWKTGNQINDTISREDNGIAIPATVHFENEKMKTDEMKTENEGKS